MCITTTTTTADTTARAAKRARREEEGEATGDTDVCVTIYRPAQLRNLMEIVGNVLKEVEFRVEADHLALGMMDYKELCLVDCVFKCDVERGVGQYVRLKASSLVTCLRTIPSHYVTVLRVVGTQVTVHSYESDGRHDDIEYKFAGFEPFRKRTKLRNMAHAVSVDIDMSVLRSQVKICRELKAHQVTMSASTTTSDRRVLHIRAWGDEVSMQRSFTSTGERVAQAGDAAAAAEAEMVCTESFHTEYLHMFMKSMERKTVNMLIDDGKPLILECPFDTEGSRVRFVLAPGQACQEETDDGEP